MNSIRTDEETGRKGDSVDLPSGSKTLHVSFGPAPEMPQFSHQEMMDIQLEKNHTDSALKSFAAAVRNKFGKFSVEPGLMEELPKRKIALSDFFTVIVKDNTRKNGAEYKVLTHPLFYCSDIEAFIQLICEERGLKPEDLVVTVGLDDGQGSLKVSTHLFFYKTTFTMLGSFQK